MAPHLNHLVLAASICLFAGPALSADNAPQSAPTSAGASQADTPLAGENRTPNLSEEQKKTVIEAIMERKSHQATPKEFKAEVGAPLSSKVDIHAMPPRIVAELPQLKDYWYAHVDKTIAIVDAVQKKIAMLIPLPNNLTLDSSGKPDEKEVAAQKVGGLKDLKPEQRRALYQSATAQPQPVPQEPLLAGSDAPQGLTLQPLPPEAASQAGQWGDLQYAKLQDGRLILVDPKEHKVAGIITQSEASADAAKKAATTGQGSVDRNVGSGQPTSDPLREREESGKDNAYTGPSTTGPNTDP